MPQISRLWVQIWLVPVFVGRFSRKCLLEPRLNKPFSQSLFYHDRQWHVYMELLILILFLILSPMFVLIIVSTFAWFELSCIQTNTHAHTHTHTHIYIYIYIHTHRCILVFELLAWASYGWPFNEYIFFLTSTVPACTKKNSPEPSYNNNILFFYQNVLRKCRLRWALMWWCLFCREKRRELQ